MPQPTNAAEWIVEIDKAIFAVLMGKSYSINDRSLTRENLSELRKLREFWEVRSSTGSGIPVNFVHVVNR